MSPLWHRLHSMRRGPRSSWAVVVFLSLLLVVPALSAERETELRATGMTFVGSRDDRSELVLNSEIAIFFPDRDFADLEVVRAVVTDEEDGESFRMTCERAELNLATNDFRAEGQVRGITADGQKYSAPWVEYEHESGLLHSSAPIQMTDETSSFRADGFRYHVNERTFQMLGNVSVEQNQ
jgi:LPS export ABC transporter protein LptC